MKSAQQPSQLDGSNPYPNWGPGGRLLGGMPAPLGGENGMFAQAYNNVSNTMENHPIFRALMGSPIGQLLQRTPVFRGMNRNDQQPPSV